MKIRLNLNVVAKLTANQLFLYTAIESFRLFYQQNLSAVSVENLVKVTNYDSRTIRKLLNELYSKGIVSAKPEDITPQSNKQTFFLDMPALEDGTNGQYIQVPYKIFKSFTNAESFMVFVYMSKFQNSSQVIPVAKALLTRELSLCKRTTDNYLKKAQENNVILVAGTGVNGSYEYHLTDKMKWWQ